MNYSFRTLRDLICCGLLGAFLMPALYAQATNPGQTQIPPDIQSLAMRCAAPGGANLPECIAAKSALEQSRDTNKSADGSLIRTGPPPTTGPKAIPEVPSNTPEALTEFQRFVAASFGHTLPIFGSRLFDNGPVTFAPAEQSPVTTDYLVGPGDEIMLRTWGQVTLNLALTVDRNGSVYIPQAGNVRVAGLTYGELAEHLRTQLARVYRNFELSVNMGQLRSIQVIVVGHARKPGTYTVSSLSTLVNALFVSGGPSAQGSMRGIQLKRGQSTVVDLDVYDLLLKGDKSADARLLPGDVIYIPPVGSQVALDGSVRNPAIYELKGQVTAGDLIQLAGGLSAVADVDRAVLERVKDHAVREAAEITLDAAGLGTTLRDGDMLRIRTVAPRFGNAITLRGNVANPGRFPWRPGLRLRNVIPDKESLITQDYWKRRNVQGFVPPSQAIAGDPSVEAARKSEPLEITNGGADINWAYAQIERQDPGDLSSQFIPFSLGKLLLENDESQNLELRPGDVITVFSQNDLRVPVSQQSRRVWLEGEFKAAGVYNVKLGETLAQLIARVGGLTPEAYLYASEFQRESTRKDQQRRLEEITMEMDREVEQAATISLAKSLDAEDTAILGAKIESQRRLVQKMRAVRMTGRIVLNLDPGENDINTLPAIQLEDGDRFMVPARPQTVNVLGSVYKASSFLHESNLRLADYLSKSAVRVTPPDLLR